MTQTRPFFLFLLLVFCLPIVRAQDIIVADSTKSFMRNDTTFLDWRYLLMEVEAGRYDTCIQGHFVIPKGTPGLMDKILRNMAVNHLADWENPDTLFQDWKQHIGLNTLPHNELGDFPREWFAIVYNQGHFYLSDDYSYSQTFEDSLIRYYYMENWLGTFSDFRKTGEDEYAFNLYHKYADTPLTIDSTTIKPVPGVTGLYLLHYGSDYNRSNCELLTTREHLKDFDYAQSIIACYIDYLNRDAFPETKTPRLTVPDTVNIMENLGRITDYSVSITPAFAKIIRQSENVLPLYQGKASVKVNGLWGVVDVSGNWILPCIYATPPIASLDNDSLFFVKQNDKKGVVDKDNKTIINTNGRKLIPFSNHHHYIPTDEPFSSEGGTVCVERKGMYGIMDSAGKMLVPFISHAPTCFINGIALIFDKDDHITACADKKSTYAFSEPYSYYARQEEFVIVERNNQYGILDLKKHQLVIPIIYDEIGEISPEGIAIALRNGRWGFVDIHGNTTFQ